MGKRQPQRKGTDGSASKFRLRWRHVMEIDRLIRAGGAPNCSELASKLEVCRRTILRDIDFMKYDLGAPLRYLPEKRGYIYAEPNWVMPSMRLSEGDLFALTVAEKALGAFAGTPWAERLRGSFARIVAALPETVSVDPADLLPRVTFDDGPPAITDPAVLQTIADAIGHGQTLRLTYTPLNKAREAQYTVDPYIIRRSRGAWYLAGKDHRSGHVPVFNLARVRAVRPTGQTFDFAASGFDPKAYFASTFSVFQSAGRHEVAIEFRGPAAQLVRERQWHASQKLKDLGNGRVRLAFVASHLADVLPWVLSWGSQARVLAPAELARMVREETVKAAQQYSSVADTGK